MQKENVQFRLFTPVFVYFGQVLVIAGYSLGSLNPSFVAGLSVPLEIVELFGVELD